MAQRPADATMVGPIFSIITCKAGARFRAKDDLPSC